MMVNKVKDFLNINNENIRNDCQLAEHADVRYNSA